MPAISVNLSLSDITWLDQVARNERRSRSALLAEIIRVWRAEEFQEGKRRGRK